MGSAGNGFADSGPVHMMMNIGAAASSSPTMVEIDWDNEEHRRCITACLVKGTYLLERKRTQWDKEENSEQPERAWWESFHFRLHSVLPCVCECVLCKVGHHILATAPTPFIYGAIFEYAPAPPADGARHRRPSSSAPSYIVAFRGTMRRDLTALADMNLNLDILVNKQQFCSRFSHARKKVEELLNSSIPNNGGGGGGGGAPVDDANGAGSSCCKVWLAGHSLGASIALDVGRHAMMMSSSSSRERNLPTFLFNPPQISLGSLVPVINKVPLIHIPQVAIRTAHASSCLLKHGLSKTVLKHHKKSMEEKFERLSPWTPNLYVHEQDVICRGFIDYFEQRERLPASVAASGTILSYRDTVRCAIGKQNDRPHLLPSAVLWKNQSSDGNPHDLQQWWQPLVLTSKLYKWH